MRSVLLKCFILRRIAFVFAPGKFGFHHFDIVLYPVGDRVEEGKGGRGLLDAL